MSRSCASCGSAVDPAAEVCPVCGESLVESSAPSHPVDPVPLPVPTPAPVAPAVAETVATVPEVPSRQICPECGAANSLDEEECSVCGEPLGDLAAERHARNRAAAARPKGQGSRTYLYASLGLLFLTAFVFLISRREEVTSPPTPEAAAAGAHGADSAHGGMPHNHPPVGEGSMQPKPEQLAQIAALEKQLKEKPTDSTKLQLADLYFETGRYPDAITLYREYIAKNPDLEIRMRMASAISASGDDDAAIAELNGVIKDDPKNQRAGLAIAAMYVNKRNLDSLTIWLNRVHAIDSASEAGQQAAMFLEKIKEIPGR